MTFWNADFFIVQKRDRETILPIIQREVEQGTKIHSKGNGRYTLH